MKKVYESKKGYKVFEHTILGYPVHIHGTVSCGFLISVPFDGTLEDKKMFDELVYRNKSVYHAMTKAKVISQVRNWIKKYKTNGVA